MNLNYDSKISIFFFQLFFLSIIFNFCYLFFDLQIFFLCNSRSGSRGHRCHSCSSKITSSTRSGSSCHFLGQAQHWVKFMCHFSWQAQHLVVVKVFSSLSNPLVMKTVAL